MDFAKQRDRLFLLLTILLASFGSPLKMYGQSCNAPNSIRVAAVYSEKLELTWDSTSVPVGSKVRISAAVYPTSNFFYMDFDGRSGFGNLTGLQPNTKYIIRANTKCGSALSTALGLGVVRTLTKVEESVLCSANKSGDPCSFFGEIHTGARGLNFIDVHYPIPDPAFGVSAIYLTYWKIKPLPVSASKQKTLVGNQINNGVIHIDSLTPNCLYRLSFSWAATIEDSCRLIALPNTPTLGSTYIDPLFTQIPIDITLDCSTPLPLKLSTPNMGGGCSKPVVTFTDQTIGSGCNKSIVRTWTAVDNCGRTSTLKQTVFFQDNTPPTFLDLPPNEAVIKCGEDLPTEMPTAVDNCSAVTLVKTETSIPTGDCGSIVTRTWRATDACGNTATYVQQISIVPNTNEPTGDDPSVPPLPVNCGQSYQPPTVAVNTQLTTALPGDVFQILGFPAKLKEVTGGNGVFTGRAKVRLPFGHKVVYADFNSIQVNADNQVFGGEFIGVLDPNFVMPDTGNLDIGGEICLPEPPVLEFGFNNDGDYVLQPPYEGWQEGDPIDPNYDPNGFDVNGINRETGTLYNENGCNREGLDSLGNPCNPGALGPYYWLHDNNQNTPTTAEGIAYATELKTTIRQKIINGIAALKTANLGAITTQRATCVPIRTSLENLATGLDKKYLFGDNDIFLKEDMNLQFSSKPIGLQINVPDRTPQIVQIEEKHIDLYYCDRLLYRKKQIDIILAQFNKPDELDILVADILSNVEHLTPEKVTELQSSNANLVQYIKEFLEKEIDRELQERGLLSEVSGGKPDYMKSPASTNTPSWGRNMEGSVNHAPINYLASADDDAFGRKAMADFLENRPEDLEFAFKQGWEWVGNTNRAFYLDAIAKARETHINMVDPEEGEDSESLMPLRIEKTVSGKKYTILIDQIKFSTTNGASLDAYFILDIPSSGQRVVFRALGVPFTPAGLSAANTKLKLASDVGIRLNNASKLHIIGSSGNTWVQWDCNGFAGMSVQADIEFCRNYLTPLIPATLAVDTNSTHRVMAHFTTTMPAWGEFVATLTMDPFALTKHQDYKWEVNQASVDFSDVSNPAGFANIASNYFSEFKLPNGTFSPQWKGFFMKELKVTFPDKFTKGGNGGNNQKIIVTAQNFIIDDKGLTGLFSATANFLPLDKGDLGGWAFSINEISIAVVANRLQGGGFGGKVHVPLFSKGGDNDPITDADCFAYKAKVIVTPTSELYEFEVKPADTMNINLWVGKAILRQGTFLKIEYKNDSFNVLANLTGSFKANGDLGDNWNLTLPQLDFENIRLANRPPYFRGGHFSAPLAAGAKIGGFEIAIKANKLSSEQSNTCDFRIGAELNLCKDVNVSAATAVILRGEMVIKDGHQRWKYKDFDIERVSINASFKGVDGVKGDIYIYKHHDTFGRGFRGKVSVKFSGTNMKIGIEALAQFGTKDDYKYFMIDLLASLQPGIEMGGLQLVGMGGGVYYHMDRDSTGFAGLANAPSSFTLPDDLGTSLSGVVYVPNQARGIGLKLMVVVATSGNPEIFNANATFEILFNTSGSINNIAIYGNGRIMAPVQFGASTLFTAPSPTKPVPVSASVFLAYDFGKKTLHGELEVFLNVENVFVGAGPNSRMGKAVLHFDPDRWYINVGTPSEPNGIKINVPVGNQTINLLETKSYLCVGTGIPPMPPLPSFVSNLTGSSGFLNTESQRATGRGIAFGASLQITVPEMKFLIFYAHLNAGLGFDVNLKQYTGITCANNGGEALGINGWYAAGQAWAFIDADVQIKFKGHKHTILKLAAAASIQAKLPNPFWARGSFGGKYKILGGLVKGTCNYKFTLGKSCETDQTDGDDVAYIKLIDELQPGDNEIDVSPIVVPTAYFGVQMGEFTITEDPNPDDADAPAVEVTYNAKLEYARLYKNDTTLIYTNFKYGADSRSLTLDIPYMLPGNTNYKFEVKVVCLRGNVLVKEETKFVHFKTGKSPVVIPLSNIAVSYPLDGMYNLYPKETAKGFIELRYAQPDLIDPLKIKARFVDKSGFKKEVPITLSYTKDRIEFEIPDLPNNKFMKLELVRPSFETISVNDLLPGPSADMDRSSDVDEIGADWVLCTIYFRTSQFDLFGDKINSYDAGDRTSPDHLMQYITISSEPFDEVELKGTVSTPPLLQVLVGDGSDGYEDWLQANYTEMKGLRENEDYPYFSYAPKEPKSYFKTAMNGVADSLLLRADWIKYEADAPGVINANIVLANSYLFDGYTDMKGFKSSFENAVNTDKNMSSNCGNNGGYPSSNNLCSGCTFYKPVTGSQCCCSYNYHGLDKLSSTRLWQVVYDYNTKKPTEGVNRPVHFSYFLPGGGNVATAHNKLDFNN